MRKIVLAIALAFTSVSCTPSVTEPIASTSNVVVLRGTQALIVAELAYNTAGNAILPLLQNGTITGENATRVREANRIATQALITGKAAHTDAEKAKAAAEIMLSVTTLNEIIGGR